MSVITDVINQSDTKEMTEHSRRSVIKERIDNFYRNVATMDPKDKLKFLEWVSEDKLRFDIMYKEMINMHGVAHAKGYHEMYMDAVRRFGIRKEE